MDDELKEIINKIDRMGQEHDRDRYNTYSYILFALTWAMLGLYLVSRLSFVSFVGTDNSNVVFLIFAVVFLVWGWVMRRRARRVKVE